LLKVTNMAVVQKCDVASDRRYSSKNIRKVGSIGFSQNFLSVHEQITLVILICKQEFSSISTINRTGGHKGWHGQISCVLFLPS
jgi:hypothetical protein